MLKAWCVCAVTLFSVPATAETFKNPPADSAEGVIVGGLTLIRDGKFNEWIATYCSKEKKCVSESASSALKRYNLPALQRRAKSCLKDGAIEVKRREQLSDTEQKVFIQCEVTAMPIPISLIKHGTTWKWSNV